MGTMGNAQNVTGYPQSQNPTVVPQSNNAQIITGHPQNHFQGGQLRQNATGMPQSNNARLPGMPENQQPMLPRLTAPTQENDYELPDERVQYYD